MTTTKNINHTDRAHAEYSASGMERRIKCPASDFISMDLEAGEASSAATEGTKAHELAELWLSDFLAGKKLRKMPDTIYSQHTKTNVKRYIQYIYDTITPRLDVLDEWFIEKRVVLSEALDIWGTGDALFTFFNADGSRHCTIIDYKNGRDPVESIENWQLITYALAAAATFENVTSVDVHIFQPNSDHYTPPQHYAVDELKATYLPQIIDTVTKIKGWKDSRSLSPDVRAAHMSAGKWCKYCPAKDSVCELHNAAHAARTKVIFDKFKRATEGLKEKEIKEELPRLLNKGILAPEEIVYLVEHKSKLVNMVNGVAAAAFSIVSKGAPLPGLKLVEQNPERSFLDDEEKVAEGLRELGVPDPWVTTTKLLTLTKAEEIVGKGKLDHLLKIHTNKSYKLVPESNPNPAVKLGVNTSVLFKEAVDKLKENKNGSKKSRN